MIKFNYINMGEYQNFIREIELAFMLDNNILNPKNKKELLDLYKNVKYVKTHINQSGFNVPLKECTPTMVLITHCVLIMRHNIKNNRYYIEVHIAEEAHIDNDYIFRKNYEYIKCIMITRNFDEAYNLMYHGEPIWPNRNETDILYPDFKIPIQSNNNNDTITTNDDDIIALFTEDKKEAKIKSNKRKEKNKIKSYIKKYGKFDRNEALEFLHKRWMEAEES